MADMNQSDHDLLIRLNTTVEAIAEAQKAFINRYEVRHADILARVTVLERKDSGDSQKFKTIGEDVRRSLDNANKIDVLRTDMNNLGDKVRELEKKNAVLDAINAIGVVISGIVGYFFGNR
jgi:hypothetical protein